MGVRVGVGRGGGWLIHINTVSIVGFELIKGC